MSTFLCYSTAREIKCGLNQRLYKESGKCFTTFLSGGNSDSPCGLFMEFYEDTENEDLGFCDCKPYEGLYYRPLLYSAEKKRCYFIFDQVNYRSGPFSINDWQEGQVDTYA